MRRLMPIVRWVRQGQGRGLWRPLRVRLRLGLLLTGLAALLALPLDRHVEAPAVLMPAAQAPLHAPEPARVERLLVREGDRVEAGQVLLELWAPTLEPDEARAHIDAQLERMRLERGVADAQDLGQRQVIEQRIEEGLATRTGLQARREALRVPVASSICPTRSSRATGWHRSASSAASSGRSGSMRRAMCRRTRPGGWRLGRRRGSSPTIRHGRRRRCGCVRWPTPPASRSSSRC